MDFQKDIEHTVRLILEKTPFSFLSVTFEGQKDSDILWCDIEVDNSSLFLRNNKEGLVAFSFLCKNILEKSYSMELTQRVIFDIEGVTRKEIEELWLEAHMMAERCVFLNKPIDLPPLNAFQRKLIHDYLSKDSRINTSSAGEGRERHIIISPA